MFHYSEDGRKGSTSRARVQSPFSALFSKFEKSLLIKKRAENERKGQPERYRCFCIYVPFYDSTFSRKKSY